MKTSFLGKKLSQVGTAAAVAGVFMMAPLQAQAVALNWSNLSGGVPGAFILLDKLNTISSPQNYTAVNNVGADKILNDGDSFSETLNLITNSSSFGNNATSFDLGGDYRLNVSIAGTIDNTGGTPITLNANNSVSSGADSTFDIVFNSATIQLFNNVTNELIANLSFESGGGSNIQLVAGSLISDVTVNALLGPGCVNCDPYILDTGLGSIAGSSIFTITTGSTRFLNFNGSNFATNTLNINLQDNGQSTTFVPEPASLALMGIGLLGLGAFRRGKKFN